MEILVKSIDELDKIAVDFVSKIRPLKDRAVVIGLSGNLGSGKTSFMQAAARALGVSEKVTSPTFVIVKSYKLQVKSFAKLIHIDAYRLDSGEELKNLGWDELIAEPQNLIFIEWPENIAGVLPPDCRKVSFAFVSETEREITFTPQ